MPRTWSRRKLGVDLPGFVRNRYMGTFSFNSMTQNESFIPMTINAWATRASILTASCPARERISRPCPGRASTAISTPRCSTTSSRPRSSPSVQNKLTYRYYSDDNNTPPLTLQNWIVNDSTHRVRQRQQRRFRQLWPAYDSALVLHQAKRLGPDHLEPGELGDRRRQWRMGAVSLFAIRRQLHQRIPGNRVRHVQADGLPDHSRERPIRLAPLLGLQLAGVHRQRDACRDGSARRLRRESVSGAISTSPTATATWAISILTITTPISGLTMTPTVGWRWDNYPTDISLIQAGGNGLGLNADHHWNAGIEADWAINSSISLVGSYTFENIQQVLDGTSTSSTAPASLTVYNSSMGRERQHVARGRDLPAHPRPPRPQAQRNLRTGAGQLEHRPRVSWLPRPSMPRAAAAVS